MWLVASSFHCRPSQIAGIESDWVGFCFDSAIALWGNWVEGKLAETDRKGRRRYSLEGLLSGDLTKGRFASAGSLIALAGKQ